MSEIIIKKPLHESIGYFDLKYLQEDMMESNKQVICEKHQKYWWEQHQRDLKRTLTQCCVNGDADHKACSMATCECHCHHNRIHNGRWWMKIIRCLICNDIMQLEYGALKCKNIILSKDCVN